MGKYLRISSHIWKHSSYMTLKPIPSEFPYIRGKSFSFLITVFNFVLFSSPSHDWRGERSVCGRWVNPHHHLQGGVPHPATPHLLVLWGAGETFSDTFRGFWDIFECFVGQVSTLRTLRDRWDIFEYFEWVTNETMLLRCAPNWDVPKLYVPWTMCPLNTVSYDTFSLD